MSERIEILTTSAAYGRRRPLFCDGPSWNNLRRVPKLTLLPSALTSKHASAGFGAGCPRKLALFTQAAQFHASSYPSLEVVGTFGNPWIRGNTATISIFFLTTILRWA